MDNSNVTIDGILKTNFPEENLHNITIKKIDSGLTNFSYLIIVNEKKYFLKIFGEISKLNIVDREFETDLMEINYDKYRLCTKIIATDFKTYRIEEYLEDIKKPEDIVLFDDEFLNKLIPKLINFESSLEFSEKSLYYNENNTIYSFLNKIVKVSKDKMELFSQDYNEYLTNNNERSFEIESYISKVNYYLQNFDGNLNLLVQSNFPLILNHNDLHKHNILIRKNLNSDSDLLLIDYEYAFINFIGFDMITYCIETFFDLEYPVYPFYNRLVESFEVLYTDEKYFNVYLKYLEFLKLKIKIGGELDYDLLSSKNYFTRISGICSLVWFYCCLISLDFKSIIRKDSFNYLDYSLDRLKIYEYTKSLIEK